MTSSLTLYQCQKPHWLGDEWRPYAQHLLNRQGWVSGLSLEQRLGEIYRQGHRSHRQMGRCKLADGGHKFYDKGRSWPRDCIHGLGLVGSETSVWSQSGKPSPCSFAITQDDVLLLNGPFWGCGVCGPVLFSTGFLFISVLASSFRL